MTDPPPSPLDEGGRPVTTARQERTPSAPHVAELPAEERGPAAAFLASHPAGVGAPVAVIIPAYNEAPRSRPSSLRSLQLSPDWTRR